MIDEKRDTPVPEQSDNRVRPEDGPQDDVDQTPAPYDDAPTGDDD